MQVKAFSAFSEFEARMKLGRRLESQPHAHVMRQETLATTEDIGRFEERSIYQIVVAYEPSLLQGE